MRAKSRELPVDVVYECAEIGMRLVDFGQYVGFSGRVGIFSRANVLDG